MEDSIGTIFYIILVVIVLIITAVGRKRKLKAAASIPPEEKTAAFDPFEAFEEESIEPVTEMSDRMTIATPGTQPANSQLESYIEEGVSAFDEEPSLEEDFEIRFKEEMLTDDQEHQPSEDLTKAYETKQQETELDKIMNEFDLKKAVILSEIINRKEF